MQKQKDICMNGARIGDYVFGKVLGTGGFATVAECHHIDNPIVKLAVKNIDVTAKNMREIEVIEQEVQILQKLNHPNIVHFYDAYFSRNNIYIFTELMIGGEMYDKIVERKYYDEDLAKRDIIQIAAALNFCHKNGVIHRDLKPENILYVSNEANSYVKVADFGLAEIRSSGQTGLSSEIAVGTPLYMSPEVLQDQEYSYNVDVWSLGVVTYIILSGLVPFYGKTNEEMFERITAGKFTFPSPQWDSVSAEAKDFVCQTLVVDSTKRLSMGRLLKHDWLTEAVNNDITENLEVFKAYNAKRKVKKAFQGIRCLQRIKRGSLRPKEGLAKQSLGKGDAESTKTLETAPSVAKEEVTRGAENAKQ